jgi:hypothetical protein
MPKKSKAELEREVDNLREVLEDTHATLDDALYRSGDDDGEGNDEVDEDDE